MSLTQEEIDKISKNLSKINNSNNDISSINDFLKYVELLNDIDTTNVKPTISIIKTAATLREDIVSTTDNSEKLLKCSGQKIISNNIAISNIMK